MSDKTKIQWADATYSPWRGCRKISPGCANCYIYNTSPLRSAHQTSGSPRIQASASARKEVLRWNTKPFICDRCGCAYQNTMQEGKFEICEPCFKETHESHLHRQRVFPSLCDWLDDEVPIDWLADFLKLIHDTPNLDWLLLTKRPENWYSQLTEANYPLTRISQGASHMVVKWLTGKEAPKSIWFGVSAENQEQWDKRVGELVKIPAAVRFVSVEPMLEEINLKFMSRSFGFPKHITAAGHAVGMPQGIHWVIFGGESGKGARPCNVDWIRDGVKQCQAAGMKAFVKQLGSRPFFSSGDSKVSMRTNRHPQCDDVIKDPKGGDMAEWPEDLRVREMPK